MTLTELVERHAAEVASRTSRKWRHAINRWKKHGGPDGAGLVVTGTIEAFRTAALGSGLSPRTIEDTISDVLCLLRRIGKSPGRGRALRIRQKRKPVPTVAALAEAYAAAEPGRWPEVGTVDRSLTRVSSDQWWRAWMAVGYWTGLRLGDMLDLKWDEIGSERIMRTAAKTGVEHTWPMCHQIAKHLEALRQVGDERVFPFSVHGPFRIRRELTRLHPQIGPQALRRLAITQWTVAGGKEAGGAVHGCRIDVMDRHYLDAGRILERAAPSFEWPACFGVTTTTEQRIELRRILDRLPEDRVGDMLRLARALQ